MSLWTHFEVKYAVKQINKKKKKKGRQMKGSFVFARKWITCGDSSNISMSLRKIEKRI